MENTELDHATVGAFLALAAHRLEEMRDELCALDGEVGDGDHGISMAAGFKAASAGFADAESQELSSSLRAAGEHFLSTVGATVGPLYATAFIEAAAHADAQTMSTVTLLTAFSDGIARRGKAALGDCTMLDVWGPAARAAVENPASPVSAALKAGRVGLEATRTMVASRGRAARLGSRTLGRLDPGARSAVTILEALSDTLSTVAGGVV